MGRIHNPSTSSSLSLSLPNRGESTGRPNALGTRRHSLLHLSDWGGGRVAGKQLSFTSQTSRRLPSVSERASCQLHTTVWIHLNAVARLQGYQPTDQLTSFRAYKRERFHKDLPQSLHIIITGVQG